MEKDFWLTKWNTNDIGFHQEIVNPDLINYFNALDLKNGDPIFVPLCGKSLDVVWLADQGYPILGVDLSELAANDFFTHLKVTPIITTEGAFKKFHYKNITILCGDFFELTTQQLSSIKGVYDCKALIALPEEMRKRYAKHLSTCLSTDTKILLLSMESPDVVKSRPPFPVSQDEIKSLYHHDFNVQQIVHEKLTTLPENLIKKGYQEVIKTIYCLTKK